MVGKKRFSNHTREKKEPQNRPQQGEKTITLTHFTFIPGHTNFFQKENGFALPTSYGVSNFHILICFYSACILQMEKISVIYQTLFFKV